MEWEYGWFTLTCIICGQQYSAGIRGCTGKTTACCPNCFKQYTNLQGINYRARRLSLPETLKLDEWNRCLDYWDSCCAYCGNPPGLFREMKIGMEHYIALTDPRPDNPGTAANNIIPACKSCNSRKHNKIASVWLVKQFGQQAAEKIEARIREYFESLKTGT